MRRKAKAVRLVGLWRQRVPAGARLAAARSVPVVLAAAFRRRRHPAVAWAGAAVLLAEAAYGLWWYRIAFAPSFGEVWMNDEGIQVVRVYVTKAVHTSAGPGPGLKVLPFREAVMLVADRRAVFGPEPDQGFSGGRAGLRSWRRRALRS